MFEILSAVLSLNFTIYFLKNGDDSPFFSLLGIYLILKLGLCMVFSNQSSHLSQASNIKKKIFSDFREREEVEGEHEREIERERERETVICCSTYFCIQCLPLACALARIKPATLAGAQASVLNEGKIQYLDLSIP